MLVEEENGTAKYIASTPRPEKSRKRKKKVRKIENRTALVARSFVKETLITSSECHAPRRISPFRKPF